MKSYEKKISLKNKIFSWNNVLDLLSILEKQSDKTSDPRFFICILCDDGFKFKYDQINEIDEKKFLSNYKVVGITATLSTSNLDVYLTINAEGSDCNSYITVESSDEMLFNSLVNQFNEIEKNIKPQKMTIFHKKPFLTYFVLYMFCITIISLSLYFLSYTLPQYIKLLIYLLPFPLLTHVIDFVQKAYPIVEMEFIPENKNIAKKYRYWTRWIWITFLLPLVSSALYECLQLLFCHR